MNSSGDRPGGSAATGAFIGHAYGPAALFGTAALLVAGAWGAVSRPATETPMALLAAVWGLAVVAALIVAGMRRRPTAAGAVLAQVVALLASAAVFGAVRGSAAAVPVAGAVVALFVVAVGSTALRADAPRPG